jgi:hypothetical protein
MWLRNDAHGPCIAIEFDGLASLDRGGGASGADDGWDAVLAGDDGAVAEHSSGVGHDGGGGAE